MTSTESSQPMSIFIVMGVAGCGKSSVAEALQKRLGCAFIEGDTFHPESNVHKMAQGQPLTDQDRLPWLSLIRDTIIQRAEQKHQGPTPSSNMMLVTCSSLRKMYRDIVSAIPSHLGKVTFCYLQGTPELLASRIGSRQQHFMKSDMLASQLATLEEPMPAEESVIVTDIALPIDQIVESILAQAKERHLLPS
ncbi:gluconate kinase 1 [Spinellus fusiger]|nr:gluconate kinase 1 [Spinellus fusiger]